MFESKEQKVKRLNRERVQRCRERQKLQDITQPLQGNKQSLQRNDTGITDSKMKCKCQYYHYVIGELVCVQCGRPSQENKIEDKIIKHETK